MNNHKENMEPLDTTQSTEEGREGLSIEDELFDEPRHEEESEEAAPRLVQLQQELAETKDKYLRLLADFTNFKNRAARERIELISTASRDILSALLPVLDDFDRAKHNAELTDSREQFSEGVQLVYQKLYNTLRQQGLEVMESNGEPFDPELHEALTEIPAPSEDLKGRVVDTIEKGYQLNGKIIRHAKVVVGK